MNIFAQLFWFIFLYGSIFGVIFAIIFEIFIIRIIYLIKRYKRGGKHEKKF